ncbi:uncharacterized protein CDAR_599411 [Caerostris darwini]|uniref:Uncharacterized protein n=1 Tax=Caerostris darwini TaxID=1538125 RepID=A0AAV4NWK2_9ARAC|nr:uncharacterized protein CDAR_599411 [Caerostris darwini]
MEVSNISVKSLLKKSNTFDINKIKKVTFCDTVKVFVDDPNKIISNNNKECLEVRYIEINIVDKSKEILSSETSLDECKVTDFLVHKVIYDNYILPDDDELGVSNEVTDDSSIPFGSAVEEEDLEFVVHKVTDHEDELIKKDSDFNVDTGEENKNISESDVENSELDTKFSKLSIENIIEHDKIIALIDQTSLGLSILSRPSITKSSSEGIIDKNNAKSNKSSLDNVDKNITENLVLSPPLQELSLEKIVKAHSENVLCELDISPLNSIIETDSESDASSEGTMIMMTSEECQKNEEHIRESLLQYQSLKEKANKTEESESLHTDLESFISVEDYNLDKNQGNTELTEIEVLNHVQEFVDEYNENVSFTNSVISETCSSNELKISKRAASSSLPDNDLLYANYDNLYSKYTHALKRASSENDGFIRKPLTVVEIPRDVREWKILPGPSEKCSVDVTASDNQVVQNIGEIEQKHSIVRVSENSDSSISKSDELENFVHESTERVERIRKRYYLSGKSLTRFGIPKHSPVRGIRPRFGSTAEILQLMQKQNNPPFITFSGTKNHMSWPCEETNSNHERNVMDDHSNHFYISQSLTSEHSSQSSIDSYSEEPLNTSCDHCSISSCPSIMVHERGTPEGASPPRPRIEINIDSPNQSYDSDSFVYYSLKI